MVIKSFTEAKDLPEGTILASIRRVEPAGVPESPDKTSIMLLTPWFRKDPELDDGDDRICVAVGPDGKSIAHIWEGTELFLAVLTLQEIVGWCHVLAVERRPGNMVVNDVQFPSPLDVPSYSR